jgi:sulfur relay (sulfurtransferase) DsrC/TusE family protein
MYRVLVLGGVAMTDETTPWKIGSGLATISISEEPNKAHRLLAALTKLRHAVGESGNWADAAIEAIEGYIHRYKHPLTERQAEVLSYVKAYIAEQGFSPTLREIAKHLGCGIAATQAHVARMQRKGYLYRDRGVQRGLVVCHDEPTDEVVERVRELPFTECESCYWRWHDECRHEDAEVLVEESPDDGCGAWEER